jgi:glutathione synthase/RimK-type ligase-like ATP-grasp enzyme
LYRIAIQPDRQSLTSGRIQAFSEDWVESLKSAGHEPVLVDAAKPEFFDQLRECDGFMWWFAHLPYPRNFARRIIQAVQHGMGKPLFPNWETIWHFDDKISQNYLLQAAGIPTARTWVFWYRKEAVEFCRQARYPLVIKLAGGITSENVQLLKTPEEAEHWIHRLFGPGVVSLQRPTLASTGGAKRRVKDSLRYLLKGVPPSPSRRSDVHLDYFMVQEFLPGNDHDTRVTVIGNRAFAFRRLNRPDDFRASGSGRIVFDPDKIDLDMVRLAFRAARRLRTQSLAVDGMYGEGRKPVLVEISYYYEGWALAECPGHWELRGDPETGTLEWVSGHVRPQDAILADFVASLEDRRGTAAAPPAPAAERVPFRV